MGSPQEAVQIVIAVEEATQKFFRFVASPDAKTCSQCNRYDGRRMTRREIYSVFPYYEKQSDLIWLPHVHPNCRCELWVEDVEEKK